ncbi:MAG: hypothetical protein ACYC8T_02685 [Myxococcaceae bacterium]
MAHRSTPWFLVPLVLPFRLASWVVRLTGRLVGTVLGFVFLLAGVALCFTVVGAIVGIPLGVLGTMVMAKSIG